MTNEDMLDDLKQYIDLKLDATESRLKNYVDDRLTAVISESTDALLEAIAGKAEDTDVKLENHETRIKKLETRIA